MKFLKLALPMVAFGTLMLVHTSSSFAKPEDTKATKKACSFCHVNAKGGKDLTDAGKYYKEHGKSLEGFTPKN